MTRDIYEHSANVNSTKKIKLNIFKRLEDQIELENN